MLKIIKIVKNNYPIFLLLALVAVLFFKNYDSGTFLSGWDNLHPEFDFKENIVNRAFFGVWQEYQGLGLLAGNGHASDIFREVFLFILSVIVPMSLSRYLWHFLMLFVGSVGTYFLIRKFVYDEGKKGITALLGGIFYILNLGAMQVFYVPYEAFSHFYAFLPWLILVFLNLTEYKTKKNLIFFVLLNFLAVPSFYIPTLFIVYVMVLLILGVCAFLRKLSIRAILTAYFLVVIVNAFWLLPFVYFVSQGTGFVIEAKINRVFTEDDIFLNEEYGKISDVSILRGFWFGHVDLDGKEYVPLMRPWINYFSNQKVLLLGYFLFLVMLVGFVKFFASKNKYSLLVLLLFFLAFFGLTNSNPPTGVVFSFLQSNLPLFKQVFRFPYTKFVVLASIMYSVLFSFGFLFFLDIVEKVIKRKARFIVFLIFALVLIIFSYPSFKGNFIYDKMRVRIPNEYFEVFNFFRGQNRNTRVANLPQANFFGWTAFDFGYRGSGFYWYGIRQPILDRAFDVWNPKNEQYYNELTQAIYTKNTNLLEDVLEKYNVTWLWLDGRLIYPINPDLVYLKETLNTLGSSSRIKQVFSSGEQKIFKFDLKNEDFVSISNLTPVSSHEAITSLEDKVYSNSRGYFFDSKGEDYVFSNLTKKSNSIVNNAGGFSLVSTAKVSGELEVPKITTSSSVILARVKIKPVSKGSSLIFEVVYPSLYLNEKKIPVPIENFVVSLPLPANSYSYLSVNNETLPIKSGVLDLGEVPIFRDAENTISLYTSKSVVYNISKVLPTLQAYNCGETVDSSSNFGTKKLNNSEGVELFGNNSRPCIYENIPALVGGGKLSTGLIDLSFEYKTSNTADLYVCITKKGNEGCVYRDVIPKNSEGSFRKQYLIKDGVSNYWLKFELPLEGSVEDGSAVIKNPQLKLGSESIYSSVFKSTQFVSEKMIYPTVSVGDTVRISNFYEESNLFSSDGFSAKDVSNKKPFNCDGVRGSVVERTYNSVGNGYIEYKSANADSCEVFVLNKVKYNPGMIITLSAQNVVGKPLQVCFAYKPSNFCGIFDVLKRSNEWESFNFVVPSSTEVSGKPNEIFLGNPSISEHERVNRVGYLNISPFDFDWVSSIKVVGKGLAENDGDSVKTTFQKFGTFLYRVKYSGLKESPNTALVLNQSFANGWVALGKGVGEHVVVNSWANGWKISGTDSEVYLVFWPQLIEFFGLFLLIPLAYFLLTLKQPKS